MVLAARGTRETEGGLEAIDDPVVEAALRARARGIYIRSAVLAFAGTVVAWWLPA